MLNIFVDQKTNIPGQFLTYTGKSFLRKQRKKWSAHLMVSRILFSRILNCVFVIVFFVTLFGVFVKNKWLFWHFLYIVKPKSVLRRSKQGVSKFGENKSGFVKQDLWNNLMRKNWSNGGCEKNLLHWICIIQGHRQVNEWRSLHS